MRQIVWLASLLIAFGWLLCELPPYGPVNSPAAGWRRTRHGWEESSRVCLQIPGPRPTLHPGLLAAFQVLASGWALLAYGTETENALE